MPGLPYDVADPALAERGARRTDFAERSMPVLRLLRERFARARPLQGVRVAACMHVTPETAALARTLLAGGAELHLAASNPLSTQDDVAAALAEQGVGVHARHGVDRAGYAAHLDAVLQARPHLLLDDGCDLVQVLVRRPELRDGVRAGCEETTTGVLRLRQMAADGALWLPMMAVNDTATQLLVANRHGTGQSTLDAVVRTTGTLLAGATVVVAGYGWCGRGIAERARGLGASVVVTETDAGRALEAVLDGNRVLPMSEAAPLADVVLTATGNRDVLTTEHFGLLRDGAVLANAGHFDVEIDVAGLRAAAVSVHRVRPYVDEHVLPGGRRLLLLAEGRLVNLSAADGHPPAVMDVSFAVQALVLEHLVTADLAAGVHAVPADLDAEVARTKLAAMGVELDALTPEQVRYLSSWA
ncbi:MAG TPA: adenosylhomocysteinase [Mycobacteriales bacterium]|nr:adenosylhomocysteinase [Mycobacteriales bacterium]